MPAALALNPTLQGRPGPDSDDCAPPDALTCQSVRTTDYILPVTTTGRTDPARTRTTAPSEFRARPSVVVDDFLNRTAHRAPFPALRRKWAIDNTLLDRPGPDSDRRARPASRGALTSSA